MTTGTSAIDRLIDAHNAAKYQIGEWTGAGEDLLHVHVGLAIFVISALLVKDRFRSPIPVLLVWFFALLNELLDYLSGQPGKPFEPMWDVINTLFWPALIFILARLRRPVAEATAASDEE